MEYTRAFHEHDLAMGIEALPNNHINDPSNEGKKQDYINNVEAFSSKFVEQGLFLFLFAHALNYIIFHLYHNG